MGVNRISGHVALLTQGTSLSVGVNSETSRISHNSVLQAWSERPDLAVLLRSDLHAKRTAGHSLGAVGDGRNVLACSLWNVRIFERLWIESLQGQFLFNPAWPGDLGNDLCVSACLFRVHCEVTMVIDSNAFRLNSSTGYVTLMSLNGYSKEKHSSVLSMIVINCIRNRNQL